MGAQAPTRGNIMEVSQQSELRKHKPLTKMDSAGRTDHKYMRDRDREKVKGIFRYHECPGGIMSFVFKAYREDPVERFDLIDGQVYEIPLGVARHLNKNCWYPEYGFIKGESSMSGVNPNAGNMMKITRKVRRCSFSSLEFIDTEDLSPYGDNIVTVENLG